MIKVTRHVKCLTEVKQKPLERGCAKQVSFGQSLTSVLWACCYNIQLCLTMTVNPSASKDVTKAMVVTATCAASKKTCKRSDIQIPEKKQERTENEQPFLSRDVWDNLGLEDKQHSFVPCACLVAWTSGIPQSWPQHRRHRCSWKLCSFPVAPSRV